MHFFRKRETWVSSIFRSQISQVCCRWISVGWAMLSNFTYVGYVKGKLQERLWDKRLEVTEGHVDLLQVDSWRPGYFLLLSIWNKLRQYCMPDRKWQYIFIVRGYILLILKPIVSLCCVCMCYCYVCCRLFPSWWWQLFQLQGIKWDGDIKPLRQVTLICQVICLRLMRPLDWSPEAEIHEGCVGDKWLPEQTQHRDQVLMVVITFTDWIRNLQLFKMDWMWTSLRDYPNWL